MIEERIMTITIKCLPVGSFQSNCYILSVTGGADALVIDCGGEPEQVIEYLKAENLVPSILVCTHGHVDHIAGNTELKAAFPDMRIMIHRDDTEMLRRPIKNLSMFMGRMIKSPPADRELHDGDVIEFAGLKIKVLHTPGHTPGGICLFIPEGPETPKPILFSGDTLFQESVGRTDFPGASEKTLLTSIEEKLRPLPPNTIVHTGHGPSTTLEREFRSNPFIKR